MSHLQHGSSGQQAEFSFSWPTALENIFQRSLHHNTALEGLSLQLLLTLNRHLLEFLHLCKVSEKHPESCLHSVEGKGKKKHSEEAAVTYASQEPFIALAPPLWNTGVAGEQGKFTRDHHGEEMCLCKRSA